jgi:hypothetical protein
MYPLILITILFLGASIVLMIGIGGQSDVLPFPWAGT